MNSIIESTQSLVTQVLTSVKHETINALQACAVEQMTAVNDVFDNVADVFAGIDTEPLHTAYVKENFNYVEHVEIVLGKKLTRKKKGPKRVISEKDECFRYIPLLESLQQLLSNERISAIILREPTPCQPGLFYDICDGKVYQSDEYFQQHKDALMIVLYHDELEVCNPLGSNAGVHKVDMFYYSVGNLDPKFRSKHCAVRLLAIANAALVKKYGIESILQPVIQDLAQLNEGVVMNVNGAERVVYGKVVICAGDTLGQHYWGGFKEGVGVAHQKCRTCYCSFEKMQEEFVEEAFTMRTDASYKQECADIEQAPTEAVRNDLRTTYGINRRSALTELPGFDVTKQLPQDIMHTLLEGTVQYEVRLVLLHFIQNGDITLRQLNGAILNHNYGYSETSDKPGSLRDAVFFGEERYKLKYNAAQTRLFLRILPYILSPMIDTSDEHYTFLVELIQIVQLVFTPVIKLESIQFLKRLIEEHLAKFKELFPGQNITPKQHYLIHIPGMMIDMGPLIRSSCFSFESAHSYFKELARKQNFKNLTLSLAKRHQLLECCNFGDDQETPSSHPLFSTEKKFGVLRDVKADELPVLQQRFTESGLLPGVQLAKVFSATWVVLNGTKFSKHAVIAVGVTNDPPLPVFGQLRQIWVVSKFVYFEVSIFETSCLDFVHQAYLVKKVNPDVVQVVPYEILLDYNVFHVKADNQGNTYVSVKYDIDDIMHEYAKDNSPLNK